MQQSSILDLNMTQMLNSGERSRDDWEEMVKAAGENLAILDIKKPVGSTDSIIEIGFI